MGNKTKCIVFEKNRSGFMRDVIVRHPVYINVRYKQQTLIKIPD